MTKPEIVIAVAGTIWMFVLLLAIARADEPRLVGYGCDGTGANGVLYAHEESDFPRCDKIESR